MLLALLIGWIVFSYLFAEFAPVIFVGIAYLIGYLFLCLWEVVKLTARLLTLLTGRAFGMAGFALRNARHGLSLGALFVFYLFDEWRRGHAGEDSADEETVDEEIADDTDERTGQDREPPAPRDSYVDALARLGLKPGFTLDDLKRAYKRAIRIAHPDAGGSAQAAQAVNAARDVIARRHGWR